MGKLLVELTKQLDSEHKQEAIECLLIYDTLQEVTGHVYDTDWRPLTSTWFEGSYPNSKRFRKPSALGQIFIKGIRHLKD